MIKLYFTVYGLLIILFSCKYNNSNNIENQKNLNQKIFVPKKDTPNRIDIIVDSTDCKDRLKEMVMSCGSGCALNLKENNFKLKQKHTYKIIFSQEMFINEQKAEESIVGYYFLCKGKTIERVYNDEITNYLDKDKSTPTQRLSFKKYGENFCSCMN